MITYCICREHLASQYDGEVFRGINVLKFIQRGPSHAYENENVYNIPIDEYK